ncbi:hypothetical protein HMPREF9120_01260 [Neisseria sp. oral taxon 020 str. F0370]|uniref:hypothetical protein n=1 Tax=Neisseria sp. KEM232 TaxID=655307 RepID=UPI0002A405EF|nr:hypothetical protein [Neisseria sp. KEM232]EKY06911.1 hypothetical protein HMPREF9120_01260 [Neisseria sp. oral taxon 020 str. F0370]
MGRILILCRPSEKRGRFQTASLRVGKNPQTNQKSKIPFMPQRSIFHAKAHFLSCYQPVEAIHSAV